MPSTIQQRFLHLLQVTSALFTSQHGTSKEERAAFDGARTAALALVAEAKQPSFEPFVAYLLGVTAIDGEYPLQIIRMLSLVGHVMSQQPATAESYDDLFTAAYLADLGFRPAWLGQKGSHSEVAAYRIKGISFPWFTAAVEKLIMAHHDWETDLSPQRCLSLIARYLALVYQLGTEDILDGRMLPSKALETLLQEHPGALGNIKFILRSLSAFPLGSWVLLSTGEPALVIGASPQNPLRPKVGYCRKAKNGVWVWEEHVLQNEPTIHITNELVPTPLQNAFINHPHIWLKGWEGQGALSEEDLAEVFHRRSEVKSDDTAPGLGPISAEPIWLTKSTTPALGPSNHASHSLTPDVSDKELQKLRAEWETNVHQIEGCVAKLKTGLIESYRRENERYREALDQMHKNPPAVPTPTAPTEAAPVSVTEIPVHKHLPSPLLQTMKAILIQVAIEMESREGQFKAQNQNLQESLRSVKDFLERSLPTVGAGSSDQASLMRTLITRGLAEIESAETSLLKALRLPIASLNELRVQWESGKALCEQFEEELRGAGDPGAAEDRCAKVWEERFELQLNQWRKTLEQDWSVRLERWGKLKQLVEQFEDLAGLLKTKVPSLK